MSTKVQSGKMAQKEGIDPNILTKLVVFAILIAVVPIGTYFASVKYVWNGNATWAAISAVVAANVVLIGYVVVAFGEDAGPTTYLTAGPGPEYLKNKEKPVSEKPKDK